MNTELEYLIQKFLNGETSVNEENTLQRLLRNTGEDEYNDIKAFFDYTGGEKCKSEMPFDFREFTFEVINNKSLFDRKSLFIKIFKIAAVFILLLSAGFFIKNHLPQHPANPKYSEENIREGVLNTQRALTAFTDILNSSIENINPDIQTSNMENEKMEK